MSAVTNSVGNIHVLGGGAPWDINEHYSITTQALVPEPGTMLLLASGLVGLAGFR
jgi:hypothetical protein